MNSPDMIPALFLPMAERNDPVSLASQKNSRKWLVVAIIAGALLLPALIFGIPNGADLPNHLRFVQPFYEAIQSGHWHPAWLAESNDGFGDPRFRFYPPGLYYLLSAARALTGNWYAATLVALFLISIIAALGAYFWARSFSSANVAMCAGILYAIAPYHLNEVYQASLLTEYAGCAILPFAFGFTERICRHRKASDVAGLAVSVALLVLTHLPLTVIGSISLLIYAALRIEGQKFISTLLHLSIAALIGLAASSFFWMTMLFELHWIKGSSVEPNPYYDYRLNFLFSPSALTGRNTFYANLLGLALIGFLLPGFVMARRLFRQSSTGRGLKVTAILSLVTFLMATALSHPIWAIVPKLSEVQFPWRWLAVASLAGSLFVAAALPQWKDRLSKSIRPRDLGVALAFGLSLIFVATQIVIDSDHLNPERFESMARDVRGAVSFKDWLPAGSHDLLNLDVNKNKVVAGGRDLNIQSWQPESRQFHIAAGQQTEARIRTYYYPHWVAMANGQTLPIRAAEDGAIQISVPQEASDVALKFQEPRRVRVVELLSLSGWIMIGALFLHHLLQRKPTQTFAGDSPAS